MGKTLSRFLLCLVGTRFAVFFVVVGCILLVGGVVLRFEIVLLLIGIAFLGIGAISGWAVRNQWLKHDQEMAEARRRKPWVTSVAVAFLIACLPVLIVLYVLSPPSSPPGWVRLIVTVGATILAITAWGVRKMRGQQ